MNTTTVITFHSDTEKNTCEAHLTSLLNGVLAKEDVVDLENFELHELMILGRLMYALDSFYKAVASEVKKKAAEDPVGYIKAMIEGEK